MSAIPAGSHTRCCTRSWNGTPLGSLGDQREHDVAAVAVREALAGRELRRVPVEHGEVLLGGRELVHRDRHQVVGELVLELLVEVVADARAVREQVLDRHVVVDEREVGAEHGPRGRREVEQARPRSGSRPRARSSPSSRSRVAKRVSTVVGDLVAAVREAVRPRDLDLARRGRPGRRRRTPSRRRARRARSRARSRARGAPARRARREAFPASSTPSARSPSGAPR